MTEILRMAPRPRSRGRRREQPIVGTSLAETIAISEYRGKAPKLSKREIKAQLDEITWHLLRVTDVMMKLYDDSD